MSLCLHESCFSLCTRHVALYLNESCVSTYMRRVSRCTTLVHNKVDVVRWLPSKTTRVTSLSVPVTQPVSNSNIVPIHMGDSYIFFCVCVMRLFMYASRLSLYTSHVALSLYGSCLSTSLVVDAVHNTRDMSRVRVNLCVCACVRTERV